MNKYPMPDYVRDAQTREAAARDAADPIVRRWKRGILTTAELAIELGMIAGVR